MQLEAVGHEFLGEFYKTCDRLLRPTGLLVVQVITFADPTYNEYRANVDFIREYIFPGGVCPSFGALTEAATKHSNFVVEHAENIGTPSLWFAWFALKYFDSIFVFALCSSFFFFHFIAGPHYARTLNDWRDTFNSKHAQIKALGFDDRFIRMFDYYFAYCAVRECERLRSTLLALSNLLSVASLALLQAGFQTRYLGTMHIVYTRPCNARLCQADTVSGLFVTPATLSALGAKPSELLAAAGSTLPAAAATAAVVGGRAVVV